MIAKIRARWERAKYIYQTEGLFQLLRLIISFAKGRFFRYENYYLYEYTLKERKEADYLPRVQGLLFKMVCTNKQADDLASVGLDFRLHFIKARLGLEKGAIAFCFFVDKELAHIGWVAMNKEAKNTFDALPYKVSFLDKQACTGGTWTNPKYRGKGLMVYGYYKRFQFLREMGIFSSRNAVSVGNIASQQAHARFGPKVYSKARYLKVLCWESWEETPTASGFSHELSRIVR